MSFDLEKVGSKLGLFGGLLRFAGFFLPRTILCLASAGCAEISMFNLLVNEGNIFIFSLLFLVLPFVAVISSVFLHGNKRGAILVFCGLGIGVFPLIKLVSYFTSAVRANFFPVFALNLFAGLLVIAGGLLTFFNSGKG